MRAQAQSASRRQEQTRAALATPSALAARRRSRTQFAGQSASEAKATLGGAFPKTTGVKAYSTERLAGKGEITKITGANTAEMQTDDEKRAVLVSSLPLQAPDKNGVERDVDASLHAAGDAYVPVNPLVDYAVSKDASEGIRFASAGVTIAAQGPGVRTAGAPQQVGDSLLWANTAADTDFMVTPTPTGVETFDQIRSPEAPESLPMGITVPEGGRIVASKELSGALEVRGADGKTVMGVSPVMAFDADGTPVPASYTISADGSGIAIEVPHRDLDVRYPILVDPTVTIEQYLSTTSDASAYGGWSYEGSPGYINAFAGGSSLGNGLYMWLSLNQPLALYAFGLWKFNAPGTSSILAATFGVAYYVGANHSCLLQGFLDGGNTAWEMGLTQYSWGGPVMPSPSVDCLTGGNPWYARNHLNEHMSAGDGASVQLYAWEDPNPGWVDASPSSDTVYMSYAHVTVEDDDLPQSAMRGDVSNLHPGDSMQIDVADNGTGVARFDVSAVDYPAWNSTLQDPHDCTREKGQTQYGCFNFRTYMVPVGNLPNGPHTIRVAVKDAAGNQVPGTFTDYPIYVNNPYPTSWTYGGANHSLDTVPEVEAADSWLFGSDADYASHRVGLSPSDQARLDPYRAAIVAGEDDPGPDTSEPTDPDADPDADLTATASRWSPPADRFHHVKWYVCSNGTPSALLRLGYQQPAPDTGGYGKRHISARHGPWSSNVDHQIKDTLCDGNAAHSAGQTRYVYQNIGDDHKFWTLIVERRLLHDGSQHGIITAIPRPLSLDQIPILLN